MSQKDLFDIPANAGIDTKTDPKVLDSTRLSELRNASFKSPGVVKKRDPYRLISSSSYLSPGVTYFGTPTNAPVLVPPDMGVSWSMPSASFVGVGPNNQVLVRDDYNIYSYVNASSDGLVPLATSGALLCNTSFRAVDNKTVYKEHIACDVVYKDGYKLFYWLDASDNLGSWQHNYRIEDETGTLIDRGILSFGQTPEPLKVCVTALTVKDINGTDYGTQTKHSIFVAYAHLSGAANNQNKMRFIPRPIWISNSLNIAMGWGTSIDAIPSNCHGDSPTMCTVMPIRQNGLNPATSGSEELAVVYQSTTYCATLMVATFQMNSTGSVALGTTNTLDDTKFSNCNTVVSDSSGIITSRNGYDCGFSPHYSASNGVTGSAAVLAAWNNTSTNTRHVAWHRSPVNGTWAPISSGSFAVGGLFCIKNMAFGKGSDEYVSGALVQDKMKLFMDLPTTDINNIQNKVYVTEIKRDGSERSSGSLTRDYYLAGYGLSHKPISRGGYNIFGIGRWSAQQSTYFEVAQHRTTSSVINSIGQLGYGGIAKPVVSYSLGMSISGSIPQTLSQVWVSQSNGYQGDKWYFAGRQAAKSFNRSQLSGSTLTVDSLGIIAEGIVDFSSHSIWSYVHTKDKTYFAASIPQVVANGYSRPLGVPVFAETNFSVTYSINSQALQAGSYDYCYLFEYITQNGDVFRSAPSLPIRATIGGQSKSVTLFSDLPQANYYGNIVAPVWYRTTEISAGGGSVFYRVTPLATALYTTASFSTNPSYTQITFTDTNPDSQITQNQALYTTDAPDQPGQLENYACPPTRQLEIFDNRLWAINDEDGNLWYSKYQTNGEEFGFNSTLVVQLTKKPVALKNNNQELVIFWRDQIGTIPAGSGFSDTGEGDNYQTPLIVTTDKGCVEPRSIILTNDGIYYKSALGIELFDGGKSTYVGAPVEQYNSYTIVGVVNIEAKNEIRWVTDKGIILVYDTFIRQWQVHDINNNASTTTVIGDKQCIGYQNGNLWLEMSGTIPFTDPGNKPIRMKIATAWIKTAGLLGFQRAQRALFQGQFISASSYSVSASFDYEEGQWANSGSFTGANTTLNNTQYRWHLERQKCKAIKFAISDCEELAMIRLQYQLKKGLPRLGTPGDNDI